MKHTVTTLHAAVIGLALASSIHAQDDAMAVAEESAASYIEAWDSGDGAAIAALYTEEAEYTSDDGTLLAGRGAIQEQTELALEANQGAELVIEVESARFLTPDVVSEDGYATITLNEETTTTMYNATHVKTDGQWLIAEVHESALPDSTGDLSAEALTRLEWLIGNWAVETDEENPATVEAKWVLEGKFIARTTTIPEEEGDFVTVEMIGYDPVDDRIRSWVFDNMGGFGQGHWTDDGDNWLLQIRSTGPSGDVSSGDHSIEFVDDDTLTVESTNRVLDGEVLPNRDPVTLIRTEEPSTAAGQ